MDHTQATEGRAAERYLLGELPAEEAEDFERHYFECADCAEAVDAGGTFIDHARVVFAEGGVRPPRDAAATQSRQSLGEWLRAWWTLPALVPSAVAITLAVVAFYQGFVVIPGLRQAFDSARVLPAFQLIGASRGAAAQISVPAGTPAVALSIDIPPDAHFAQYRCVLRTGGRTTFEVIAPAPADGQPITILAPTRGLSPADYEFTIYGLGSDGAQHDKVTDSTFKFQFK
jgi:hypothetical protein